MREANIVALGFALFIVVLALGVVACGPQAGSMLKPYTEVADESGGVRIVEDKERNVVCYIRTSGDYSISCVKLD